MVDLIFRLSHVTERRKEWVVGDVVGNCARNNPQVVGGGTGGSCEQVHGGLLLFVYFLSKAAAAARRRDGAICSVRQIECQRGGCL